MKIVQGEEFENYEVNSQNRFLNARKYGATRDESHEVIAHYFGKF